MMKLPESQLELLSQQEVDQLKSIGEPVTVDSFSGTLSVDPITSKATKERVRLATMSLLAQLQLMNSR